ncbi:hypothetical protein CEXT_789391 [Caerostris extrusa]|uniref:Uncharacterized protein n=1 Tax=Caerostris extrusa TaxID=172846 RepID=A0AAV4XKX7_CAEEX|nr:hypothetical protein CEXT_789391 [Caerostris extrusa]
MVNINLQKGSKLLCIKLFKKSTVKINFAEIRLYHPVISGLYITDFKSESIIKREANTHCPDIQKQKLDSITSNSVKRGITRNCSDDLGMNFLFRNPAHLGTNMPGNFNVIGQFFFQPTLGKGRQQPLKLCMQMRQVFSLFGQKPREPS